MTVPQFDHHFAAVDDTCEPVFVVGALRSGTTLLRMMLNAHPKIAMLSETWWGTRVWDRRWAFPMSLSVEPFRTRLVETFIALLADERRGDFPLDFAEYRRRFEGGAPQLNRLLSLLGDLWAEREGKPRWGEKTPYHARHLGTLHWMFPRMRAVHIVRDPRDVAASMAAVPFVGIDDSVACALIWREVIGWVDGLGPEPASALLTVRYEDLIQDPQSVLQLVCSHVDLPYDRAMLDFSRDAGRYRMPEWWHDAVEEPLRTASQGRWRRDLSALDAGLIEGLCQPEMRRHGYEPEVELGESLGLVNRLQAAYEAWLEEGERPIADHVSMHRGEYRELLAGLNTGH